MGDGYRLQVDELGGLITSLDEAAGRMTAANGQLRAASAEDLGSRDLDGAGRVFQDRWEYGIGKIADAAGKMTEALQATKRQYEDIEKAVAELFPDPGGAPPGPTDCGWGNAMAEPAALAAAPKEPSAITRALGGPGGGMRL